MSVYLYNDKIYGKGMNNIKFKFYDYGRFYDFEMPRYSKFLVAYLDFRIFLLCLNVIWAGKEIFVASSFYREVILIALIEKIFYLLAPYT